MIYEFTDGAPKIPPFRVYEKKAKKD